MLARPTSRAAAAVAVVLATLAFAGCSGGGADSGATGLLRQTFSTGHPIHSGQLSLALGVDTQGVKTLKGPLAFKLTGPFQSTGKGQLPRFDLTLNIQTNGQSLTAGGVSTADKVYLLFQGTPYTVPDAQFAAFRRGYLQAQANSTKQKSNTLASLGIDPTRWLINPRQSGTQTVGGAETVHITAGIDMGRLLDDLNTVLAKANRLGGATVPRLPQGITPQQRSAIKSSVKSATVDVYTGKADHILRRLSLAIKLAVPSSLRSTARGLSSGNITFDLLLSSVNQPQTINAPANARPLSDLLGALGAGALGGSLGSSGGAGATGGGGSAGGAGSAGAGGAGSAGGSAGTGSQQRYLQCLQQAGQDIRAVQKCASLLGK